MTNLAASPAANPSQSEVASPDHSSRPVVLVFATGGTIGMRETSAGLAPDPEAGQALEAMLRDICDPLNVDFWVNHLSPAIDSANADAETAPRIARAVRARVRTKQPRGVVITHGTDTLAYTGARLAFELADLGTPVVLTGSQYPHGAIAGDARANLSLAIRAAVRAAADAPPSIAFAGKLLPAVRAFKAQAEAREAFRAERPFASNPLGVPQRVAGGRMQPARVIAFRFVPGVTAEDLRAAVAAAPDGLVLVCYGSGNAPMARPGMAQALREVCAKLPVVAVTECVTGGVDPARYAVGGELAAAGVMPGGDMTLEAALAKLAFGLDLGLGAGELAVFIAQNSVGERS